MSAPLFAAYATVESWQPLIIFCVGMLAGALLFFFIDWLDARGQRGDFE